MLFELIKRQSNNTPTQSTITANPQPNCEDFVAFFREKSNKIESDLKAALLELSSSPDYHLTPQSPLPTYHSPKNNAHWNQFSTFNDTSILNILSTLKPSNHFNDSLSSYFFKELIRSLVPLWTKIVKASLLQGEIPDCLKSRLVLPILKKTTADPEDLNNFRPITNTPTLEKLIEKCVHTQLCNHIEEFQLLDQFQSGFRQGHSTKTAITHIVDDALTLLDRNESCLLILLDLSSAFDTAKHDNLLGSHRMGLSGAVLKWFASFLHDRTQRIKSNQSLSDPSPCTLGAPQGSSLSPTLFNLFIDPLTEILKAANIQYHMYADDTQLYMKISPPDDIKSLNWTLHKTLNWLTLNHLKLNTLKTEFLLISLPKHAPIIEQYIKNLSAFNCTPQIIDSTKSLGIVLDRNLSMQDYISASIKGANFEMSFLRKLEPFLLPDDLKSAVQALVISRLEYGNATLCGLPKYRLAPLRASLNAAARLITGSKKYNHISPDLKTLNWLPFEARIHLKLACMAHNALHFNTPLYRAKKLELSGGARTSRSSCTLLLKPKKYK